VIRRRHRVTDDSAPWGHREIAVHVCTSSDAHQRGPMATRFDTRPKIISLRDLIKPRPPPPPPCVYRTAARLMGRLPRSPNRTPALIQPVRRRLKSPQSGTLHYPSLPHRVHGHCQQPRIKNLLYMIRLRGAVEATGKARPAARLGLSRARPARSECRSGPRDEEWRHGAAVKLPPSKVSLNSGNRGQVRGSGVGV
jgi:hypothetical protein